MDDVEKMLTNLNIDPNLAEELSETLYDQITQYTKGELLADIQMAGPAESMESYRKAYAHGRKKTAENVHRARNRVTRPEIAETMDDLDEKYKKWKKDIAYLKDIDAYDFGDAGMVSILLDLIPDEVQREVTTKNKTTGSNAAPLKKIMLEVENHREGEGPEAESRRPEARGHEEEACIRRPGSGGRGRLPDVRLGPRCQLWVRWVHHDGKKGQRRRGGRRKTRQKEEGVGELRVRREPAQG